MIHTMIWPFCKLLPGRTRGEHAIDMCKTWLKLFPNHHHRYFISFQDDIDEYSQHSLTLEQIENKYRNRLGPRYKSNIVQRIHNVLHIMENDVQNYPNSSLRLLIFSDGHDNQSTQVLTELHRQTINELRSFGISVTIISFDPIDFGFSNAAHYNNTVTSPTMDDFPLSVEETQYQRNSMYSSIC